MSNKIKYGVVYSRVSTDDQAENGASLDVQEQLCKKKLMDEGFEVLEVVRDEGKSAKDMRRKGIQKVLRLVESGKVSAVCALSSDRISRKVIDFMLFKEELKKRDVLIYYIHQQMDDDTATSKIVSTVLSAIHEFHLDTTSEKVKDTQQAKLDVGILPSRPPVGYTNIDNPNATTKIDTKIIGVDPIKGPLMTETFKLYATGNFNAYQLCDLMYKKGLTNSKGNQVSYSRFYTLLRNRFYLGEIHWNDRVIKNAHHQPIIDESTFNAVQGVLNSQNHHASRARKHEFLLRGFMRCPTHNKRITAEWHLKKRLAYYHCPNRTGCGKYAESVQLETKVADKFKELEFNPEFVDRVVEEARKIFFERKKGYNAKRQALVNKKTAVQKELETAEVKMMRGILEDERYVLIRDKAKTDVASYDEQLDELISQHDVEVDVAREIFAFTKNIYQTYVKAPFHAKRGMLGFFWEKFDYEDGVIIKSTPTLLFRELQRAELLFVRSATTEKAAENSDFSEVIIPDLMLRDQDSNLEPTR